MSRPLTQILDEVVRRGIPVFVALTLVVVGILRMPNGFLADVTMMLPVVVILFWSLRRPEVMPILAVFLIGLTDDMLRGNPIGFNALLMILAAGFVRSQRKHLVERGLSAQLGLIASAAMFYEICRWVLIGMLSAAPDFLDAVFRMAIVVALFVPVSWLLSRTHRGLLKPT